MARNEKEEKKIKAFRKEKRDREEKMGGKSGPWFRGAGSRARYFGSAAGGARSRKEGTRGVWGFGSVWDASGSWVQGAWRARGSGIKCFSCLGVGHVARDCVGRDFESLRKQGVRVRK